MLTLQGRVIVITGGAGLLGRAFTRAVASAGGCAVIAEPDLERARAVAETLAEASLPGRVETVELDISRPDSISRCIEQLRTAHGTIDGVVNNAYPRNTNYGRHFFDVEYEDLCENLSTHLGGYFAVCQQFARLFKAQQAGVIVNMGSIYGVVAPRFDIYEGTAMTVPVEYALIKSAVIHMTRYLAAYLKGTGVRVNSLSPGGILDGQPEPFLKAYRAQCSHKGMLDTDDVTGTLIYLLSDASCAVNGQNIVVDDGFCL